LASITPATVLNRRVPMSAIAVGAILTDYYPLSIIAWAQAMCPSKPSDFAIA